MSLESPKVSIIISAYNEIKYLPATVNSILQQTFYDFEVIIFNNNSAIMKWFAYAEDPRLRFIYQKNLGIAQILNRGIFEARGEYISFINVGDLWHPSKLRLQVFYLDHYPRIGLVHSWLMAIDDRGNRGKIIKHELSGWVEAEILEQNQISYQTVMVRGGCFGMVGLFDLKLQTTPDWDMWIRISRRYQFMAIAEPLVYWRQHTSISENWLVMEIDMQITIEKAYAKAPAGLVYLKHRSYAHGCLDLALIALQGKQPDPMIVNNYCQQALEHSPKIGFTLKFFQVRLAVMILYCLRGDRYSRLLLFTKTTRRLIKIIITKLKRSAYSLLNWLLEEDVIFGKNRETNQAQQYPTLRHHLGLPEHGGSLRKD